MRRSLFQLATDSTRRVAKAIGRAVVKNRRSARPGQSLGHLTSQEDRDRQAVEEFSRKWADVQYYGVSDDEKRVIESGLDRMGYVGQLVKKMLRGARRLMRRELRAAADLIKTVGDGNQLDPNNPQHLEALNRAQDHLAGVEGLAPEFTKEQPNNSEIDARANIEDDLKGEFSDLWPTPRSSNVYSFQYRYSTSTLYVRFKAPLLNSDAIKQVGGGRGQLRAWKGSLGRTVVGRTDEPGPLYAYFDVPVRVFNRLVRSITSSAGKAVWDDLRIRGTVHGHQYRYSLVEGADVGGSLYVPRRATKQGFRSRSVTAQGTGRRAVAASTLPEQTMPMRGTPDRGRSWQDKRFRGRGQ